MADLVVRATLRDNVLPQLAKIAAGMQALEKQMEASSKRTNANINRQGKKTQEELFKIDNAMRGTARRMASRMLLIGGAIAAAAGHAVALTAAIWPLIGALGAIPAVTVGGVAGIAALVTGFAGLGKAMQKTGGGSASSANQIAAAQRRIEIANRGLRDSQEALNDAWEEARDRLRDIQTSYAGAQLDVEAAALSVRDAELAMREARSSGDRQERARADLALRQARLSQIEATNRLSDVEQEYHERLSKGVEGSDEVRDATERQADAIHELAEAQKALNDAMKGGGGGGGDDAYAKLSASGRKLVDTLRALGPAWREVQQATQEAMLSGVAESMQRLSDKFLPVMLRQLPAIAQGWNNVFTSIEGVATQDARVQDLDESLGLMAVMWQRVGNAFGPFFEGFLDWVRVGSDFMPRLGAWVERQAEKWAAWSAEVRETGEAHRWIENALTTGHKLNELFKSWGRSLFEVFRLGQDKALLDNLIAGSRAFERFVKSAEGSARVTAMWARLRDLGSALWKVIKQIVDIFSQLDVTPLTVMFQALADVLGLVSGGMGVLGDVLGPVITAMVAMKVATLGVKGAIGLANAVTGPFTVSMAKMDTTSKKAGLALKRIGIGLGAVALAGGAAAAAFGDNLNPQLDALVVALDRFNRTGRIGGEMTRLFGDDLKKLDAGLRNASSGGKGFALWVENLTGLGQVFDSSWTKNIERVKSFDSALAQMVRSGDTALAAESFELIAARAEELGIPVEKLKELFPEYFGALEAGEGVQRDAADATRESVDAWRDAANALDTYMDMLNRQADPIFNYVRAQQDVAEAQAEVNRLVEEGKQGTPEYEQALLDLTEKTLGMQSAMADAAAVDKNILIPALQDLVDQGILTKEQVDLVTGAYNALEEQARAMDGMRSRIYLDVLANTAALDKALSGYYAQYGQFLAAGYRAEGGPVQAGRPYVVGERGMEVFVPSQNGTIVPNNALSSGSPVGAQKVEVTINLVGADSEMKRWFQRAIRVNGAKAFGLQPA